MNNITIGRRRRLDEVKRERTHKEKELLQAIDIVQDRMARLAKNVKTGGTFNSLGELQGLGAEVDRLTGELALLIKMENQLAELLSDD